MQSSVKKASIFSLLSPLIWQYKLSVLYAFLALILASGATLAIPKWVGFISDALSRGDVELMKISFMETAGLVVVMGFASAFRFYNVSWLGERVVTDIRKKVFSHLMLLPKFFYDQNQSGELISRITTDTTLVERVVGTTVSLALRNLLMLMGSLGMLLYTSVKLTALVLVVLPLALIPTLGFLWRYRVLSKESQGLIAKASSFASQVLSVMDISKAYQYEKTAIKTFNGICEDGFSVSKRRILTRAMVIAILINLMLLSMVAILWFGMLSVLNGEISTGELSQFFMYAVFLGSSIANLSEVWGDVMRASGALARIVEILDEKPQEDLGDQLPKGSAIVFEDVRFAYPARDHLHVLHGVSFSLQEKTMSAIVGPSGAGKSTIFKLLMRYYGLTSGNVTLGGVSVSDISLSELRSMISYVGHDAGIFPASVRDNIAMGRVYSDVEIEKAAEKANIADFISTLPDGYDTELGERGILLSEGQRQRIALARAILKNSPIVLLDEATNALDAITEEAISQALLEVFKDKTVLVIAHRLATVVNADQIIVMDQGEVEAVGTHKSLTKKSEIYARLAKIQLLS